MGKKELIDRFKHLDNKLYIPSLNAHNIQGYRFYYFIKLSEYILREGVQEEILNSFNGLKVS